jgi:Fic family protein
LKHPFSDGNGRVGHEILKFMLSKNKYPKLMVPFKTRMEYLNAMKSGDKKLYKQMVTGFTDVIINQYENSLKDKLKTIITTPEKTGQLGITDWINE